MRQREPCLQSDWLLSNPSITTPRLQPFLSARTTEQQEGLYTFGNFGTGAKVSYISEPFLPPHSIYLNSPTLQPFSVILITRNPFSLSLSDICYTVNQTKKQSETNSLVSSFPSTRLPPPTASTLLTSSIPSFSPLLTTWRMSLSYRNGVFSPMRILDKLVISFSSSLQSSLSFPLSLPSSPVSFPTPPCIKWWQRGWREKYDHIYAILPFRLSLVFIVSVSLTGGYSRNGTHVSFAADFLLGIRVLK